MSRYHERPVTLDKRYVRLCGEGDIIELFPNICAQIYVTPGHHPSCLTFAVGDYLFTGDAFIPSVKVVTNLPGGNKEQAKASMERIEELLSNHQLCAGHSQNENSL